MITHYISKSWVGGTGGAAGLSAQVAVSGSAEDNRDFTITSGTNNPLNVNLNISSGALRALYIQTDGNINANFGSGMNYNFSSGVPFDWEQYGAANSSGASFNPFPSLVSGSTWNLISGSTLVNVSLRSLSQM